MYFKPFGRAADSEATLSVSTNATAARHATCAEVEKAASGGNEMRDRWPKERALSCGGWRERGGRTPENKNFSPPPLGRASSTPPPSKKIWKIRILQDSLIFRILKGSRLLKLLTRRIGAFVLCAPACLELPRKWRTVCQNPKRYS